MLTSEFIILLLSLLQPLFVGLILLLLSKLGLNSRFFFFFIKNIRFKFKSINFFECAVYSRLLNIITYDIFMLSLCILFILYDVDLIFFFTEVLCVDYWVYNELLFIFINLLLLFCGLWYDYLYLGFNWSY